MILYSSQVKSLYSQKISNVLVMDGLVVYCNIKHVECDFFSWNRNIRIKLQENLRTGSQTQPVLFTSSYSRTAWDALYRSSPENTTDKNKKNNTNYDFDL